MLFYDIEIESKVNRLPQNDICVNDRWEVLKDFIKGSAEKNVCYMEQRLRSYG